jgi:hypothetical protein
MKKSIFSFLIIIVGVSGVLLKKSTENMSQVRPKLEGFSSERLDYIAKAMATEIDKETMPGAVTSSHATVKLFTSKLMDFLIPTKRNQ